MSFTDLQVSKFLDLQVRITTFVNKREKYSGFENERKNKNKELGFPNLLLPARFIEDVGMKIYT